MLLHPLCLSGVGGTSDLPQNTSQMAGSPTARVNLLELFTS